MKREQILVLLQVDALRHDFVDEEDAPFLHRLALQGISGRLLPAFGFEPDGAYLAGLYPDECDGAAHYWYEPETSPFRWIRYLVPILRLCPKGLPQKALRKLLTFLVRNTMGLKGATVANIPLELLKHFAPAHRHFPYDDGFGAYTTIFFLCSESRVAWLCHSSPIFKTRVDYGIRRLKSELRPPIRFAFWHISDLDTVGHRYGPCSPERKAAMRKIDVGIRDLLQHLKNLYDGIDWVVIGDHGMAEVRSTLNVHKSLCEAGITQGQRVLYFLDSTMARFWFFEGRAESVVISVLDKLQGGRMLGQADLDRYHLNYPHNRFGDLFFLADPGVLISPNFYQGAEPVKGMHGYAPEFSDQQSAFIIYSPSVALPRHVEQPVDMRRIFPTVLKLLNLELPDCCGVQSLL